MKFMTGLLLGVGIGLLLAPEKGEDTREALAETADQWKTKWNKLVGKAGAKVDDLKALLGQEMEGVSTEVRNRILTILDEESATTGSSANGHGYKDQYKPI